MNNHVTVLEIDGNAIAHNLNYFKQKLRPETKTLAVVKAFGYGSDGVKVASFLQDKVDYFAVAYAHEQERFVVLQLGQRPSPQLSCMIGPPVLLVVLALRFHVIGSGGFLS